MRRRRHPGAWIAIALVAVLGIAVALRVGSAREVAPAAEEVSARILGAGDVEVAVHGRVEDGIAVSGSLDPYRIVEVRAQLAGTLDRVLVDRGTRVREGQVLALYDAAAVRSQLAGAEAGLAAARSAALAAAREEEAAEALHDAGAVSERELRQARSAAAAARAAVRAAEARLVEARDAAARARVAAPIAGVVSRRGVSTGEAVAPGQPLFTVVDTDTLELAARVPAHQVGAVAVGGPVVFSVDADPGRRLEGHVSRVDPVVDPATRQVTVYVYVPNTGGALVGGLHATGRIVSGRAEAAVTVAREAVRGAGEAAYVIVVEAGRVVHRPVALGPADAATGRVAVREGVEAGAVVVVGPAEGLAPGTRVEVHQALPASGEEGVR
jgi:RND family efflux transporter MFP subunit